VSKDYLALLKLLARVDGEEATFNVERVFTSMMSGIERVGLGPVPEWNTVWRTLLSKNLRYKATGTVGRDELNEVFDVLGTFSLSEATTQQIKSVYTSSAVLVSNVFLGGVPLHMFPDEQPERIPMDKAEFDHFDVLALSMVDKPPPGRLCDSCSVP